MYQALYRKWRPQYFDDVVGQEHITRTLKQQVMNERLSHAYLFTGTRGTGKTTCAKIMARAVNCENPVQGNPCGKCPACEGILSGSVLDVVEIDAASNNGVDQVRTLRDEAVYAPAAVKKRVYIIDEVHMLTIPAFNALLKILEEPPAHLMFILATTELHKVPATILSRCQRFSFKRIQPADIQNRMRYIAQNEGIDLTEDGAALLARLADGALRDALSLLDQCAISGRRVDKDAVLDALGLAGNLRTAHLMDHIRRGKTAEALQELNELYASGKDVSAVLDELAGLTRDLLLRQTAGSGSASLMAGGYDEATLNALAKGLSPQRLLHMLSQLQSTLGGLKTSANRKTDAELCLIRLCDRRLDGSVLSLSERLSRIEAALASGAAIPVQSAPQEASVPPFVGEAAEEAFLPPPPEEVEPDMAELEPLPLVPEEDIPVPGAPEDPIPLEPSVREQDTVGTPEPPRAVQPVQEARTVPEVRQMHQTETKTAHPPKTSATRTIGTGDPTLWQQLAPTLKGVVGPAVFGFIRQRMVTGLYDGRVLTLYAVNEFLQKRLLMDKVKTPLERAASAMAGVSVRVQCQVGSPPATTGAVSRPTVPQNVPVQDVQIAPTQAAPLADSAPPFEVLPAEEPSVPAELPPLPTEEGVPDLPPFQMDGPDPMEELLAFAAGPGRDIITVE